MALSVGELVAYLRLDGGQAFDRQVGSAQRSLDMTGRSATKMGAAVDKSEVALKGAGRAAETASAASGKLRAAQLSVVAAQERYNALMTAGSGDTARLASAEAALIRSQQRLATIKPPADPGGMSKLRTGALGAIETVGKLGLSLGVFELAVKGLEYLKAGNELTTALNGVQAASRATDQQMTKVRATAIGMGKDLTIPKATAVDAADAIQDLVKAGVSLDRAMVAARPAMLLAAAAQVDIADAARVTGDVMDDFHLKADQASHVANVLAAASNSAGGGLMDLFDGMKYAGPSARTLGIDVSTTAAALVELAKSGMQGSLGGTAFSNMLARLNPQAKGAREALHDLGVNAFNAKGQFVGLPTVFDQLHAAMERMNPQQFSAAVQIAFGARAKNAVFNFAHGGAAAFDEFYKKMQAGNVQDYADKMNRGLSAAGSQLHKEVTAWAIDLGDKFQPALAKATFALGDDLPRAVGMVQHVLQPLEQEVGAVLVPTFHLLGDTLGLVGVGLRDVGSILDQHRGSVQVVATVVLGMWAAWKGYTIAKTAVTAISSAIDTMRLKAMYAKDSIAGIGTGATTISAGALALGGLGIALGVAAYAWQKHAAAVAASKQEVADFTATIKEDSGALGDNTKQAVFNALQKQGAINAAKTFGLSLSDVTDASLGNAAALNRVNSVLDDWKKSALDAGAAADNVSSGADNGADAYYKLRDAIDGTSTNVKKAVTGYQDQQSALGKSTTVTQTAAAAAKALATATVYSVDASGQLVQAQQVVGGKVQDTTEALVKQKTAAELLKDALDALNGVALSQEQTTNSYLDALDSLSQSVKANGHSLDQQTAAGRKNRETLVSIIEAAKAQAQATADTAAKTHVQTDALKIGNEQLKKNEDQIRKHAASLGLSKSKTDALIAALGKLVTIKPMPMVDANTRPAEVKISAAKAHLDALQRERTAVVRLDDGAATPRLAAIQREMDALNGSVAHVTVQVGVNNSVGAAVHNAVNSIPRQVPPRAAGGSLPEGYSTINEQGWELLHKQGSKVEVIPHEQAVKMLPQGPSVPAFAAGTTAGRTSTPYQYDGIYYATAIAAENARTRAQRAKPAKPAKSVTDTIIETAGHGAAYGIASYIRGQIPSVKAASRLLSVAVNDAFDLKGVQAKLGTVKADLANLAQAKNQFTSSTTSSLLGQVDVTKYGDAAGMIAALRGGTGSNEHFAAEERKLGAERVPTALIQALSVNGPNAGLDVVANAGKRDLAQIVKSYSAFTASARGGGSVAGNIAFGSRIAADQREVAKYTAQSARTEAAMVNATLHLARILGKPQALTIKLNGKDLAVAEIVHGELKGVVDELRHVLVTGRKP